MDVMLRRHDNGIANLQWTEKMVTKEYLEKRRGERKMEAAVHDRAGLETSGRVGVKWHESVSKSHKT